MASPLNTPSPVPTYITLAFCGLIVMQPMARLGRLSLTGDHVVPPFTLLQIPPLTDPHQSLLRSVGLTSSDRVRPPMFDGPRLVHDGGSIPALREALPLQKSMFARRWSSARCRAPLGICP